MIVMIVIVTTM